MISDLLSTRPVGTNTSLTTKVTSAVDQDKSESFTLLGLPVGLSAAPLPLEGAQWTQNGEHTLERDADTFSNNALVIIGS